MAQVHPHTGTETLVGSPSTANPKSGLTPKTDPGTPHQAVSGEQTSEDSAFTHQSVLPRTLLNQTSDKL